MTLLLLPALALAAEVRCSEPADPAALRAATEAARASFVEADREQFEEATARIDRLAPCLEVPGDAALVAEVHTVLSRLSVPVPSQPDFPVVEAG